MTSGTTIYDEIRGLIDAPLRPESRAELEHALTGGYAHALALEAERHRLERRLAAAAASFARRATRSDELATLGRQIEQTDHDLGQLRALLVALKARFDQARAAA